MRGKRRLLPNSGVLRRVAADGYKPPPAHWSPRSDYDARQISEGKC